MNTKIIESYVVRIYRRGEEGCSDFVGVVEDPGSQGTMTFHTREELMDILGGMMTGQNPVAKRKSVGGKMPEL